MSQYYAAYTVLGLLLMDDEIEDFKAAYIDKNIQFLRKEISNSNLEEIQESVDEWIYCNELLYVNETEKEKPLSLIYVSPDQCDGMLLYPASNYNKTPKYNPIDCKANDCLIIEADYQPSTIQQLAGDTFYQNYNQLLSEFKSKLQALLPPDFPYEDRIGDFLYACYA